jgi:SAM-dependent methyltransferase
MYVVRSTCRCCGGSDLEQVLSLGELPLPEALLLPMQLDSPERRYPLDVAFCRDCSLLQLLQTVAPSEIYDERYRHLTASEPGYLHHLQESAAQLIWQRSLDGNSYVIEAGSNDGSMLKFFQARGVPTLGIDPAPAATAEARRAGIATLQGFFTKRLATQVAADGRRADVFLANHLLQRVPDVHGFLAGVRRLLADDGIAAFEVPYVRDLIEAGAFDTIDHEQLCYFSLTSLLRLFDDSSLTINHVERTPVPRGSLRFVASASEDRDASVNALLEAEATAGLDGIEFYTGLRWRAELIRARLLALLGQLKRERKSIVGYGASGNGSTMLNYCEVDGRYLDYVVDPNPQKQGRFMPGVHLAVLNPDRLVSNRPDFALLLSRGARDEALSEQEAFLRHGGRFIETLPEPAVI